MVNAVPTLFQNYAVHNEISNLLFYLLENQSYTAARIPDSISNLAQYLNSNYTKDMNLDAMSHLCGLSKYHLQRKFKKYYCFTPHEYIDELRVSQAKNLLATTDIPSYKIGCLVGISNEANFIRLFKKKREALPVHIEKN